MSMSDIMSYLSLADWQINKFYTNYNKVNKKVNAITQQNQQ